MFASTSGSHRAPPAPMGSLGILGRLFDRVEAEEFHMPQPSSSPPTGHGKRPADEDGHEGFAGRPRGSEGPESDQGEGGAEHQKQKAIKGRGSRACTGCRAVKSRCVTLGTGSCERCTASGNECVFVKSNRGRRPGTTKKPRTAADIELALLKMESTLESAFQSFNGGGVSPSLIPLRAPPQQLSSLPSAPDSTASFPPAGPSISTSPANSNQSGSYSSQNIVNPPRQDAKMHSLPDNALNPLGLLAEYLASLTFQKREVAKGSPSTADSDRGIQDNSSRLGVANEAYFQPTYRSEMPLGKALANSQTPPELIASKIISLAEADELFALFFEHLHRHFPVMNPDIHTPAITSARSPFLFSCICTVASRYYRKRTDGLYRKCLAISRKGAFASMHRGWKSPETAQGFLLLSKWNQPAERFEEELTYQWSGIAIRLAMDLNLQRKTTNNLPEDTSEKMKQEFYTEVRNRERLWSMLFVSDRSLAIQMGKPIFISKEDAIIKGAKTWWREPGNNPQDRNLCAMVELHRIAGRIVDVLYNEDGGHSGLNKTLDYPVLINMFHGTLGQWHETWQSPENQHPEQGPSGLQSPEYYFHYYTLLLFSFGVQYFLDSTDEEERTMSLPTYCYQCFESATAVIKICEKWHSYGWLTYTIDPIFVSLSYSATFLLKLAVSTFSHIIPPDRLLPLVESTATMLEACALDHTHTPALYGTFLRALLKGQRDKSEAHSRNTTRPTSPEPNEGLPETMPPFWDLDQFGGVAAEGVTDALNGAAVDMLVSSSGFWDNMLMPGFGGPLVSLSGGNGIWKNDSSDPYTYLVSRPSSPNPHSW